MKHPLAPSNSVSRFSIVRLVAFGLVFGGASVCARSVLGIPEPRRLPGRVRKLQRYEGFLPVPQAKGYSVKIASIWPTAVSFPRNQLAPVWVTGAS